jgi:hypothetical protein
VLESDPLTPLTLRTAAMKAFSRRRPTCETFTFRGAFFDLVARDGASTLDSNTHRGVASLADATNVQGTSWPFFMLRADFIGCYHAVRRPDQVNASPDTAIHGPITLGSGSRRRSPGRRKVVI